MFQKLIHRLQGMIGAGTTQSVNDSKGMQILKIKMGEGEIISGVERVQNYGMTSNPPTDSEAVVVAVNASPDNPLAIAVDSANNRITDLEPGEVAVYSKFDNSIVLKADGSIVLNVGIGQKIYIGGDTLLPTAGVVTGECLDPVTGAPFPDKSTSIFARKI